MKDTKRNPLEVLNQVPPFEGGNLLDSDPQLRALLDRAGSGWALKDIRAYGAAMGAPEWRLRGFQANENPPVFQPNDRFGHRINALEFHPAYHDLMRSGIEAGIHSMPWTDSRNGAHMTRLALMYLHSQNEAGTDCPITMTFAAVPALQNHFPRADEWLPRITARHYDPENKPWFEKNGLTIGMAMTEKQGGTDVRANSTEARPTGARGPGEAYLLTGHKWFCSAPMCDAFLTLAQTEHGLSCFLMPRWHPEGRLNDWYVLRLKDKLGNRSNASSEIEMRGALGWLVGEEGRGVPTIIEMVAMTRYDCMIGSAGLMRRGVAEALHHAKHRLVMGKKLIDQALMRNVLADLGLESMAALALSARAAELLDTSDPGSESLLRLLLPVGKFWLTKRTAPLLAEAMECLGGNGYVEESILPRLYREAPVNAIWEGSGNVQCLDLLRAMRKTEGAAELLHQELGAARGLNNRFDAFIEDLPRDIERFGASEFHARQLAGKLALAWQVAALFRTGETAVAQAFCDARLAGGGYMFGELSADLPAVLERLGLD